MNGLNTSNEDAVECPLCMEPLEVDDLNFYPCTCGYQICRFCWHRIRTDENKLCPACRKEYPENPADFTPLTQEEMIAFKSQKRQRDQQRKQKITENRKHLANVRVVQKNLVFVVGLPPRLADADILKKHEYFGKFGKIHKVVINPSTTYAGVQGPSASAYVTYVTNSDALRAIQSVNNIMIDGRLIKTSLGTTKYCSHFMKNQQCPKSDCMYLHELGDPDASFTKEEMHQGKHQEYEKRLHDALIANGGLNANSNGTSSTTNTCTSAAATAPTATINIGLIATTTTTTIGNKVTTASDSSSCNSNSSSNSSSSKLATSAGGNSLPTATPIVAVGSNSVGVGSQQSKEAWPSLSTSPVSSGSNNKETASVNNNSNINIIIKNGSSKKDKTKHEKTKNEKNSKTLLKNMQNGVKTTTTTNTNNNNNNNNSSSLSNSSINSTSSHNSSNNKNNNNNQNNSNGNSRTTEVVVVRANTFEGQEELTKADKGKEKRNRANQLKDHHADLKSNTNMELVDQEYEGEHGGVEQSSEMVNGQKEMRGMRSNSNSSSNGSTSSSRSESTSSSIGANDSIVALSESPTSSGKCTPGDEFADTNEQQLVSRTKSGKHLYAQEVDDDEDDEEENDANADDNDETKVADVTKKLSETIENTVSEDILNKQAEDATSTTSSAGRSDSGSSNYESTKSISNKTSTESLLSQTNGLIDTSAALSKLNLFDDNNSFFSSSSATSLQQSLLLKNKYDAALELRTNSNSSQLPDLLSGIDGFQNSTASLNEWEEALKVLMLRNNRQIAEQLQFHQLQQQQQQHQQLKQQQQQQQELQKRNNLLNIGLSSPLNSTSNFDFASFNNTDTSDLSRISQTALQQQQQHLLQQRVLQQTQLATDSYNLTSSAGGSVGSGGGGSNGLFELFNFHKNQQQQQQQQQIQSQQYLMNGLSGNSVLSDHLRMASLLENNRLNYQYLADQPNGLLQKQRMMGKLDQAQAPSSQLSQQQQSQTQTANTVAPTTTNSMQQSQNRFTNQFTHQNLTSDDDLGFDPFIETQKALAELIENEQSQSTTTTATTNPIVAPLSVTNNKLLHQQLQQPQPPQHHHHQQQQQQHTTSMTQHQQQQQILDNLQRARMPPPGFNHMNAGGYGGNNNNNNHNSNNYGMTRNSTQQNTSKLLPMVNMPGSGVGGVGMNGLGNNLSTLQQPPPQQQQPSPLQLTSSWAIPHLYQAQQSQQQPQQQQQPPIPQNLNEAQMHAAMSQNPNSSNHNKAFCNTDWTSMDPAILSYRQYSFPQQPQQMPPQHHSQQQLQQSDMFMQHLTQQQQQPQQGGFNSQPPQYNSGLGLPNGLLNPQQNSQAQMNFSHSNWLNTEQSLFMNSLPNGFTANNFDKFSIPMPPGIHPGGLNKQQKTECIN